MNDYLQEEIATQDYAADFYKNKRYTRFYSLLYHRWWAKKMLCSLKLRSPILDNGCGTGFMANFLDGYDVFGVDVSSKMVEAASKTGKYRQVLRGDSQNLPFNNSFFLTVINRGVLHHLENPQKALDEISRILAKGGEVAFTETLFNVLTVLPRKIIRGGKHFSHLHKSFREKELKQMIESSQLEIKKVYYLGFLAHVLLGFPEYFFENRASKTLCQG